jgi:dihydroorotase-like cyclic amidohydrolase
MMGTTKDKKGPSLLDVVALLSDLPAQRLARGQVGTIVEQLDEDISLVEFSDEQGRAYAVAACPLTELLALRYVPEKT